MESLLPGAGLTNRLMSLIWGLDPLLHRRDLFNCDTTPDCILHQGCGSWVNCVSAPPLHLYVAFLNIFSCRKFALLLFITFSEIVVLYVVVVWMCSWKEVIFRVSLLCCLDPSLWLQFLRMLWDERHLEARKTSRTENN